jgi:hypothetical protein
LFCKFLTKKLFFYLIFLWLFILFSVSNQMSYIFDTPGQVYCSLSLSSTILKDLTEINSPLLSDFEDVRKFFVNCLILSTFCHHDIDYLPFFQVWFFFYFSRFNNSKISSILFFSLFLVVTSIKSLQLEFSMFTLPW